MRAAQAEGAGMAGMRRRRVLGLGAAGVVAGAVAAIWPGPRAVAAGPRPVRLGGGLYLVDGWLLSAADLRRLGLAAGGPQAARSGWRLSPSR
jgi:hypothetical protein